MGAIVMNQADLLTAQPLSVNANALQISDQLTQTDLQNYYRFSLDSRSSFKMSVLDQDSQTQVELLDQAGTVLQRSSSAALSLTATEASAAPPPFELETLLSAGTYYIRVASDLAIEPDDYTLKVSAVQSHLKTELLWFDPTTGATTAWVMDGATRTSQRVINPDLPFTDLNWKIVSTGDFNRDGQDDILLRNFSTGENAWWVMQGTRIRSVTYLESVKNFSWNIVGTGDYNQDGQLDLLWRNSTTGENNWWVMKDALVNTIVAAPVEKNLNKNIVGIGDYNQDRQPDLLWRDFATGENSWWVMNGSSVLAKPALLPVPLGSGWKMLGTRDFNSDGQGDVVWHNEVTGANTLWLMNGSTIANTLALPTADPKLQLVGFLNHLEEPAPVLAVSLSDRPVVPDADTLASATTQNAVFSLSNRVSATDLNDFYRFSTAESGVFTASLSGLSGDADVRLIQDKNQNGAIDTDEVLAWQWERGTLNESVRRFLTAGDYFVQVMYNEPPSAYPVNYSLETSFTPALKDNQAFEFGITFGRSLGEGLTQAAKDAIVSAAAFWENVITARSAIAPSPVLNITVTGQSMTDSNGTPDFGTLARSGPWLGLDGPNLIISGGNSTLNLRRLSEFNANPTYLRDIMIHEFAHILGFGTLWESVQFMNAQGTIFEIGKNLIDRPTSTYKANTYAGWTYGDLLGPSLPTAVPIEPQIFAHWDETRFDAELLTPYLETPGITVPVSKLTLASLRDLGWNINMGAAQAYALPLSSVLAV